MIIEQFNKDITQQLSDQRFKVKSITYVENRDRLNLIIINDKDQTLMKLGIANPQFSVDDFELNNAIVTGLYVKRYIRVFNSRYFEVAYIDLKENQSDKTVSIKAKEVFAHDKY